ncbi:MAG: hypothetical protein AB8H86_19950 [Polyangiales bacterium]
MLRITSLLLLALSMVACGDDDASMDSSVPMDGGFDGLSIDAGPGDSGPDEDGGPDVDGGPDAGPVVSACDGLEAILSPIDEGAQLALISTDFTSSAVSVVSRGGTTAADWITSGTTAPSLTATLGGDVVFPTEASPAGQLIIIDRFGKNVVTNLCLSGGVIGQLNVGTDSFGGNPHDVAVTGPDTAWVTRYDPNTAPGAEPEDAGSDVIGFNPVTMERNGMRIDLSAFGGTVSGMEGDAVVDVAIAARPDRMVLANENTLVVGLDRLPGDQAGAARGFGPGQVALVNLTTLEVTAVDLPGGANCGQVARFGTDIMVACKGYSTVGFGGPGVRETSGIYRLAVSDDGVGSITAMWQPGEDELVAVWSIVAVDTDKIVGLALGDFGAGTSDEIVLVDLTAGTATSLWESEGAFSMGQGVWFDDMFHVGHTAGEDAEVVSVTLEGVESFTNYTDSLPSYNLTTLQN